MFDSPAGGNRENNRRIEEPVTFGEKLFLSRNEKKKRGTNQWLLKERESIVTGGAWG